MSVSYLGTEFPWGLYGHWPKCCFYLVACFLPTFPLSDLMFYACMRQLCRDCSLVMHFFLHCNDVWTKFEMEDCMCEILFSLALTHMAAEDTSQCSCKAELLFSSSELDCVSCFRWPAPRVVHTTVLSVYSILIQLFFLLSFSFVSTPASSSCSPSHVCSAQKPDVATKAKRGENHLKYVCWRDESSAVFSLLSFWWVQCDAFPDQSAFQERSLQLYSWHEMSLHTENYFCKAADCSHCWKIVQMASWGGMT